MFGGSEQTTTTRQVQGLQIPDGNPVELPAGTPVRITQSLGDTFTIMTPWGQMVRIEASEADAIGKEVPEVEEGESDDEEMDFEDRVWAQLEQCYDPEIPVNIVELGLVYDCTIEEGAAENGGARVGIKMTLTAPGCGMGPVLADDVRRRLQSLDDVEEVDVELVFDPPWNPNMMSEAARLHLGMM